MMVIASALEERALPAALRAVDFAKQALRFLLFHHYLAFADLASTPRSGGCVKKDEMVMASNTLDWVPKHPENIRETTPLVFLMYITSAGSAVDIFLKTETIFLALR